MSGGTFLRNVTAAALLGAAAGLYVVPVVAAGPQGPAAPAPSANASPEGIDVNDKALVKKWGIRVDRMRLTAAGYMLDFRYTVIDASKAAPLFERKTKPVLRDEATGAEMAVPVPPKTGALRNSNPPRAGRSYFMFFANPGRFLKPGSRVTVTIGAFRVTGITLEGDTPQPVDHTGHEGHIESTPPPASTARVITPPVLGDIPLVDQDNRATSLREAVDAEGPVFVNFIFTTCTTVCPVMTAGFKQLQQALGADRDRVRLVSISIDPDVDTVATLREYAERQRAGASWQFLTGPRASIEAAQRAFGAYRGDKNNHAPATYFRRGRQAPWQAVDGLSSAGTLLSLYRVPATGGSLK